MNERAALRARMGHSDVHYGGGLVSGARVVELWHDVATELCIRLDGDEGLFAGYSNIEFLSPIRAGDFIEVSGEIIRVGTTSREMSFEAHRYAAARPEVSDSSAVLLAEPELVARATGTCVVPKDRT